MLWLALALMTATGGDADVAEIATRLAAADPAGALRAIRELEARVAAQAPLEVLDGQVLSEPAPGLGIYTPLAGGVVRTPELFLYAQVRNHGVRPVAAGYELHLVSDLIVLDAAGEELARDEGFGESRYTARAPHRDTFVNIALRVTGLDAGKYRLRLVVHDKVSGKTGQIEVPFAVP